MSKATLFSGFMITVVLFVSAGCQKDSGVSLNENAQLSDEESYRKGRAEVVYNSNGTASSGSVQFKAELMTALNFIKQRGENPSENDVPSLIKEHVLIIEMEDLQASGGIYSSQRLQLSTDELNSYMMSGIIQDISVIQGEEEYFAQAVQFDKDMSSVAGANKLRAFLFFNNLPDNKEFQIKYFDRLFGAGAITL